MRSHAGTFKKASSVSSVGAPAPKASSVVAKQVTDEANFMIDDIVKEMRVGLQLMACVRSTIRTSKAEQQKAVDALDAMGKETNSARKRKRRQQEDSDTEERDRAPEELFDDSDDDSHRRPIARQRRTMIHQWS